MKIPTSAPTDVQQAFREVWAAIDKLNSGALDMKGRRVTNAGISVQSGDLVTRAELDAAIASVRGTKA